MRVSNMSEVRHNIRVCRVNWRIYRLSGKIPAYAPIPTTMHVEAFGIMDEIVKLDSE